MVELMKIMVTSFKRSHACTVILSIPNPAAGHPQPTSLLETPGHSLASLGQSLVGSLLLSPGSWCTQGSVCALQESIFRSCVSSGSSVVGLMVTFSKRTNAIPKSAVPRAPVPVAVHCWPVPPQEMLKHSFVSISVRSLGPGAHKVCLSPLGIWREWGLILNANCPSYHLARASPLPLDVGYLLIAAPVPTVLPGFLWTWTWGISSVLPAPALGTAAPDLGHWVFYRCCSSATQFNP